MVVRMLLTIAWIYLEMMTVVLMMTVAVFVCVGNLLWLYWRWEWGQVRLHH